MKTLLTVLGSSLGSVVGFQGMFWLTSALRPDDNKTWPPSAFEYSLVFGLPLGAAVFGLLGYALATGIDKRRASKPLDLHMPGGASSESGQSACVAPRPAVLCWIVPAMVALLLGALATFPERGIDGTPPFPLFFTCWFVIPVVLFSGYVVWMCSSRPRAGRSKSPGKSREAWAKWLLILAGGLPWLALIIAFVATLVAVLFQDQLKWHHPLSFVFLAVTIWIAGNIVAACLFLAGLWTQAFADRWYAALTLWNGIYFGLCLLFLSVFLSGW